MERKKQEKNYTTRCQKDLISFIINNEIIKDYDYEFVKDKI